MNRPRTGREFQLAVMACGLAFQMIAGLSQAPSQETGQQLLAAAEAAHSRGDTLAADHLFKAALRKQEDQLGRAHPELVATLIAFARNEAERGEIREAMIQAARAEEIARHQFKLLAAVSSEKDCLQYATGNRRALDLALTLAALRPNQPEIIEAAWDMVVRARGAVFEELAARQRLSRQIKQLELEASSGVSRQSVRSQLAQLETVRSSLFEAFERRSRGQSPALLNDLLFEQNRLEAELSRSLLFFRDEEQRTTATFQDVSRSLPAGSHLVAFVLYEHHSLAKVPTPHLHDTGRPSYLAFVLSANRKPRGIPLGGAKELEGSIHEWRREISNGALATESAFAYAEQTYRRAATELRERIWDPIRKHLHEPGTVFLIPDDAIHLIQFGSLPSGDSSYLVEGEFPFAYLSTERDLLSRTHGSEPKQGVLIVADPDFASRNEAGPGRRSFPPLHSSHQEANVLERLLRQASWKEGITRLTGGEASEDRFKAEAPGYRLLHISTHGFYKADGDDPMLAASGLALSGANRTAAEVPSGREDGILTAEEILSLGLEGADLVVLSGCETGRGSLIPGEGLFGFKRAFQLAGASQVLTSLWRIDDRATSEWMEEFYRKHLVEVEPAPEAAWETARTVLLSRRQQKKSTHPFFWAPFALYGHRIAPPFSIQAETLQVVLADVVVTDGKNRIVSGLRPEDFLIREDGVPQAIDSFQSVSDQLPDSQPKPIILLLDFSSMTREGWLRARKALLDFLKEDDPGLGKLQILVLNPSVQVLLDWTTDREEAWKALQELSGPLRTASESTPSDPTKRGLSMEAEIDYFRQLTDSAHLSRQSQSSLLSTLQQVSRNVRHLSGRKTLILLQEQSRLVDPQEAERTINLANAGNLAIYGLDVGGQKLRPLATGLVPSSPLSTVAPVSDPLSGEDLQAGIIARDRRRMDARGGESVFERAQRATPEMESGWLGYLCESAGGFLLPPGNNLREGLQRVAEDVGSHYLMTYKPLDQVLDGTFRSITVETLRHDLKVRHRLGYLAVSGDLLVLTPRELDLLTKASQGSIQNNLPISLRYDSFPSAAEVGNGVLTVAILPDSLCSESGADLKYHLSYNTVLLVEDSTGRVLSRLGTPVNLELDGQQYERVRSHGLTFSRDVSLQPGNYSLRLLVENLVSGRVGYLEKAIEVPSTGDSLLLSSLVVTSQVVPSQDGGLLQVGEVKFIPEAQQSFEAGERIGFFARAYHLARRDGQIQLKAIVRLKRPDMNWSSPASALVAESTPSHPSSASISSSFELKGLPPGKYFVELTVSDLIEGSTVLGQTEFEVVAAGARAVRRSCVPQKP